MAFQTVFKRYELKYLLTLAQKEELLEEMKPYMSLDKYGRTTVRNIYYDTMDELLVRRSIEKPFYKEKLRIRSYSLATEDSTVFVELKKKYDGVVYKRRISLSEAASEKWVRDRKKCPKETQIAKEIDGFIEYYKTLAPKVFLSYEREAYFVNDGGDFRITFDENILARTSELSLRKEAWGESLLADGRVLMELKCSGGIPIWMVRALNSRKIYKSSFSKYGEAYKRLIFPEKYGNLFCIRNNATNGKESGK